MSSKAEVKTLEEDTAPRRSKRHGSHSTTEARVAASAVTKDNDGNKKHKPCSSCIHEKLNLTDLPTDALSNIASQMGDMGSILNDLAISTALKPRAIGI